jgi:hypothetical protein
MNLISLLILPPVIAMEGLNLGGTENKARFAIAVVAAAVLIAAIAFSKRKATPMDADVSAPAGAMAPAASAAPTDGDDPKKLAADALDRWIMDLGDEDAHLRAQLREAKSQLR